MPLTLKQKQLVTEAINAWVDEKNTARSGNKLAEKAGINAAYVSRIKQGTYEMEGREGKPTVIRDSFFERIADAIGLNLADRMHWDFINNYTRITSACRKAQKKAIRMVIDGWTRMGKTHSLERYTATNDYVLYVKCTQNMTSKDLLEELLHALGIYENIRGNHAKLRTIKARVTNYRGYLIIIDEVEVVKPGIYGVLKDISDWANDKAGFIICGMDIIAKLDKLAEARRPGFPQLRGRFFGHKTLTTNRLTQGEVLAVCEYEGITNNGAQNVLADNVYDLDTLAQYVRDIKEWQANKCKKITGEEVRDLLEIGIPTFKQRAA